MKKYKVQINGLDQFHINKINTMKRFKEQFHIMSDGHVKIFDYNKDKFVKKVPADQVTHIMSWLSMCYQVEILPESLDITLDVYVKIDEYVACFSSHTIIHHVIDCVETSEGEDPLVKHY